MSYRDRAEQLRDALIAGLPYMDHKRDCPYRVARAHCACGYRAVMGDIHNLANTNPPVSEGPRRARLAHVDLHVAQSSTVRPDTHPTRDEAFRASEAFRQAIR